jgi:hypothetical protein
MKSKVGAPATGQKRVPTTDGFKGRNLYRFDRHTPEERPAIGNSRPDGANLPL